MSVEYHELVSCPDQKTPFDPAQEDWKETDQGMETCELIGRLFHPQDVVRLCVTGAASNIHTETTVCAIEGKAENMQRPVYVFRRYVAEKRQIFRRGIDVSELSADSQTAP